MPRYEFSEGTSNKYWDIEIKGQSVTTRYGRIGSDGQSTTKTFPDAAKAKSAYDKLIKEKSGKGYVLKSGKTSQASTATSKPAVVTSSDPDALYLVTDGSDNLWAGYGSYLVNGYARRIAGTLELIRTGPYSPAVSFLHEGEVLVNEALRKALEESSLRGVAFKKTIKKKIVSIAWHNWDRKAEEPKVWPRRIGEPDLYFDRKHDPAAAKALGPIFELDLMHSATIEGPDEGAKKISLTGKPSDLFYAKHDYREALVAIARAKNVLQRHADSWVRFEQLQMRQSSKQKKAPPAAKQQASKGTESTLPEPALRIAGPKEESVYDVAFSSDNKRAAVQLGNWLVQIWDLEKRVLISEDAFRGPTGKDKPTQLAEYPEGTGVALHDGKLFGLRGSGRKALLSKKPGSPACSATDLGPKDDGYGAFSPDQKCFVWPTGTHLAAYDLKSQKIQQAPWKGMPDYSRPVVAPNATHTALIQNGAVIWIETFKGKEIWRQPAPERVSSTFLMDQRRLFICSEKGWQIINISNGTIATSISVDEKLSIGRVVSFGADRLLVAYTTGDPSRVIHHHLATWDCKSAKPARQFELNSGNWGRIDFLVGNFDGSWVGAVVNDESLLLWPNSAF